MSTPTFITSAAEQSRKTAPILTGLYPLIGRGLFALPFFLGSPFQYPVSPGSPPWQIPLVHAAKIILILLSGCVLSGLKARQSAAGIMMILFVLGIGCPVQNVGLLGGAMMIGHYGSGPYSLDRPLAKWVGEWLDSFFRIRYSDINEWRAGQRPKGKK